MDIDELLFGRIVKYLKLRRARRDAREGVKVFLADVRPRLTLLGRIFSGRAVEIFPAEREGGYKDDNYFLPHTVQLFSTAEQNLGFYFYRLCYLSIQQSLRLNWSAEDQDPSLELSRQRADETAKKVLAVMARDYPLVYELYERLRLMYDRLGHSSKVGIDWTWFFGKWMKNTCPAEDEVHDQKMANAIRAQLIPETATTIKAKSVEEINSLQIDKKQQEDYTLNHNFEKVETAEEFNGVWRDFDGDDELQDHQDALDELNMRHTVRVDDPVHSVYQAEFIENTSVAESKELDTEEYCIPYPEWNYKRRLYKKDFCKVFPEYSGEVDEAYYRKTIDDHRMILNGLRKELTDVNNKWQEQRRQTDGHSFDLDAIVDLYADVHAQKTPSERVYLSNRKRSKDLSILLLLDVSLSSDSYALGNRIIDVEKQVSILFGEILHEFSIDFSIAAFYSKTRNYSRYSVLKGFEETWTKARYKIGAAQPSGYTRIGAALRHAGAELDQRNSKNKWVLLLSDGKPNDYDRYEGKYGIQDIKQALRELSQRRINAYALAIEAQARYYLPQMFGQNHYQILHTPSALLHSMVHLFEKIRYSA